jgi:hypothetical protein
MRTILTGSLGVVLCVALTACGSPTRSAAAYCHYFYGQGGPLRNHWIEASNRNSQDPFAELSSVFADLPEAANFMHQLSLRAPETIAPEVQALATGFQQVASQMGGAASDPLGALAGGFVLGMETSEAEQRVNKYTLQHCGPPPGSEPQDEHPVL